MPQATDSVPATLRAKIFDAFGHVNAETTEAFRGRHWTQLQIDELFHHRHLLFALSGTGFRAYIAAYLTAALSHDPLFGSDIQEFLVLGLHAISKRDRIVATAGERLSTLDADQRAAVAGVLTYLEGPLGRWYSAEIRDILKPMAGRRARRQVQ